MHDRMSGPKYTPLVDALPATVPFVGPETQERSKGRLFAARLGANENVFGPSPKAIAAMQATTKDIWMYGDPENHALIQALSAHHAVPTDNIVVGEGIDGLLGYLVRLFIAKGDSVVTSQGAYPTFNYHVNGFGGTLHKVPYDGDHEDPVALVKKAKEVSAKLIYFSNPDNPMGTWHDARAVQKLINAVPTDCLLVLDEAYIELAPNGIAPIFDTDNPNVIRMRTFSKGYGMAGARVGYAIGATPLIKSFGKIRNHFGMNRTAQAGALAALADQTYLAETKQKIEDARRKIDRIARDNGLTAIPSATNFVAIDCGLDGDFARAVLAELVNRGIFARMPFVAPQDRCIRISCGTDGQMASLEDALKPALIAASRKS